MSATHPEHTFEAASGDDLLELQEWSRSALGNAATPATREDILQGVRSLLRSRMDELLRGSRLQLQQALYRFDVDEGKVRDAFASDPPTRLPDTLAELVLQRAIAKIRSRRRWAGHFDVP